MRAITLILSAVVCLIAGTMTTTRRGYGWQVHRAGEPEYRTENGHGWAEKGELPAEWEQIKRDPTIDQARIYTSAQQRVRADKRRILDSKEAS